MNDLASGLNNAGEVGSDLEHFKDKLSDVVADAIVKYKSLKQQGAHTGTNSLDNYGLGQSLSHQKQSFHGNKPSGKKEKIHLNAVWHPMVSGNSKGTLEHKLPFSHHNEVVNSLIGNEVRDNQGKKFGAGFQGSLIPASAKKQLLKAGKISEHRRKKPLGTKTGFNVHKGVDPNGAVYKIRETKPRKEFPEESDLETFGYEKSERESDSRNSESESDSRNSEGKSVAQKNKGSPHSRISELSSFGKDEADSFEPGDADEQDDSDMFKNWRIPTSASSFSGIIEPTHVGGPSLFKLHGKKENAYFSKEGEQDAGFLSPRRDLTLNFFGDPSGYLPGQGLIESTDFGHVEESVKGETASVKKAKIGPFHLAVQRSPETPGAKDVSGNDSDHKTLYVPVESRNVPAKSHEKRRKGYKKRRGKSRKGIKHWKKRHSAKGGRSKEKRRSGRHSNHHHVKSH